jgi:type I restriction enzyme M protein
VKKGKPKNYIPEEELRPLAAAFLKSEAVEGEIAVITTEQASAADYNLSPSRWVGLGEEEAQRSISTILSELYALDSRTEALNASLFTLLNKVAK